MSMSDIPIILDPELLKHIQEDFSRDQRRWKWAIRHAISRVFTIDEMYNFLGSAGGDEARAEAWLPTLDEFTRTTALSSWAMKYTIAAILLLDRPPTDDNKETP